MSATGVNVGLAEWIIDVLLHFRLAFNKIHD